MPAPYLTMALCSPFATPALISPRMRSGSSSAKPMLVNVAAFYQGTAEREKRLAWVNEFKTALQPPDDSAYVGFLTDDGQARIREAYPGATWDRLVQVKSTYDPTNLFKLNQNISPGYATAG